MVLGQMVSKDPLQLKLLYGFILWCWKAFGSPSVKAQDHKHFENKLVLAGVFVTTFRLCLSPHAFLVNVNQFRSKIHGRLLRLPEYSSESVWYDLMASWALMCGWEANQNIFQGVLICLQWYWSYCNSDSWPLLLLLHWSPTSPMFFTQPFSITMFQKNPASLLQPNKERLLFILLLSFFSKTSSVLSYLYKQSYLFFLWITSAGFISFCGKYDMRFWLKWHFCLSKFSILLKHQTEC